MSYFNPTPEEREADTQRRLREWDHFAGSCFADKQTCISCGCMNSRGIACPTHKGSQRYHNYLMERMVEAQEALVFKKTGEE